MPREILTGKDLCEITGWILRGIFIEMYYKCYFVTFRSRFYQQKKTDFFLYFPKCFEYKLKIYFKAIQMLFNNFWIKFSIVCKCQAP